MKDKLLYGLIPALIFIIIALSFGCLIAPLDAQDATPTAEYVTVRSFGPNGVPIIPARSLHIIGRYDYYGAGPSISLGPDIIGESIYWRYIRGGVCYALEWRVGNVRVGNDGYPHPDASWEVRC